MTMRANHILYRGTVNRDIRVTYAYKYEDGQFCPVVQRSEEAVTIFPSYGISISEGFEKGSAFITSKTYYSFVLLLNKTVKLVSEHMFELFPDMNKMEFEIDSRTLERFQTEKAMSVAGMTMLPTVWVDETNNCYPALKIETLYGTCTIPFEDCMNINQMFKTFDPLNFGLSILRIIGKIS